MSNENTTPCRARQTSDQMTCDCGNVWDMNDPHPPVCRADSAPLSPSTMVKGARYNWKGQPERLVYLGHNWSGNGFWHQFAKVDEESVWCEVLDAQIPMFEATLPTQAEAPTTDELAGVYTPPSPPVDVDLEALREMAEESPPHIVHYLNEAADEIERLRAKLASVEVISKLAVDATLPEGAPESDYFVLENALQCGFEPVNEDASVYAVSTRRLVEFAKMYRDRQPVPHKVPIPPPGADVLDVMLAEGWNQCCDEFFGGKPAIDPLVITIERNAKPTQAEAPSIDALFDECERLATCDAPNMIVEESTRAQFALLRSAISAALATQPAPVQAEAVGSKAEPLTDEWIRSMCKHAWVFETAKQWVRAVEAAHGIGAARAIDAARASGTEGGGA